MKVVIINKNNNSQIPDKIVKRIDSYLGMRWNKIVYDINIDKNIEVEIRMENEDKDKVEIIINN